MPSTLLRHALFCTIDGVPTRVYEADGQHGVDRPIATGSVTLRAPTPGHIDLNVPIEVQGGYRDGIIRPVLSGRITDTEEALSSRGALLTVNVEGWAALLDWKQETDLVFPGPVALYEIVRSLCQWRGVPKYQIDAITDPTGTVGIILGGVAAYDGGAVIIPRRTSPLAWLRRTLGLFGYRIFDTPDGTVRVQRVSGAPVGAPTASYVSGENLYRLRRTRDLRSMVTYITVEGPQYTDADGITVVPRSIAEAIPESQYLLPPGYRAADIKDDVLVTPELAAIVRNVAEIDGGAPTVNEAWETRGDAWRAPGEAVSVTSPHLGTAGSYWLMAMDWRIDGGGYTADMQGWAGGGEALPAGIDLVSIPVLTDAVHVGDERVDWYEKPTPSGKEVTVTIEVPETYTALYYTAKIHGSNSFMIDGTSADATVSKIETWQEQGQDDPDKPIGTAEMPVVNEYYERQLPYGKRYFPVTLEDGSTTTNVYYFWHEARGSIPGRFEKGTLTIKFISGEDTRIGAAFRWDDWEIDQLVFHFSGAGTPALPIARAA